MMQRTQKLAVFGRNTGIMLLIVMLAAAMLPSLAQAATTVSVGAAGAEVYATAHAGSTVIGRLAGGSRVQVNSFDDNWAEVVLSSDTVGYVATGLLNFGAPTPPIVTLPPVVATVTVANGPLNVHSWASLGAPVIAELATGQSVQLAGYDASWAQVILSGGRTGYVVTSYLSFGAHVPTPAPTAAHHDKANTIGANATVRTDNGGPLHLREHPSFDSGIIHTYANASRVQVMSQKGAWYYVKAGSNVGYMDAEYVVMDAGTQVRQGEGFDAVVHNATDGEILHLRERPDTQSESLGGYHNGTYVEITVMGTEWHQVIVDDQEGFMMAEYVRVTTPDATPNRVVTNAPNGALDMTVIPQEGVTVEKALPDGAIVTVITPDIEWTKVQYEEDGKVYTGFVKNGYLEPAASTFSVVF